MAITSNCAEIIITNPQGSVSFNKLITTTELSPAKTIYSEDRVYLIQNSENEPQTFWWNLEKAIADGYADLEELYDYFVAEIANQCGGGGGGGIESIVEGTNITVDNTDPLNPIISVQDITLSGEVTGSTSLSAIDKTAITNKTTETIVGTDLLLFGDTSDSNNLKKGLVSDIIAAASGGAVALSAITAATGSNTINNGANTQTWQFNSLTSNTGLVLSSNSTAAASNSQTILSVEQSGVNANALQSTYGMKIKNTKTNGKNIAAKFSITGGTTNNDSYALELETDAITKPAINIVNGSGPIQLNSCIISYNSASGTGTPFVRYNSSYLALENNVGSERFFILSNHPTSVNMASTTSTNVVTFVKPNATSNALVFGGLMMTAGPGFYLSELTSFNTILSSGGTLSFSGQVGVPGNFSVPITPSYIMSISGTHGNVGIGTTTPVASAILDLTSTTKGLAIPTMTATQASAISTPKKSLMIYVTDTNGTFTSAGWWGYNGTIWKLILAE